MSLRRSNFKDEDVRALLIASKAVAEWIFDNFTADGSEIGEIELAKLEDAITKVETK